MILFIVMENIRKARSHYKIFNGELVEKKSYDTEDDALYVARLLNSSKDKIWKMVAYKCDKGGKWHVGSTHKRLTDEERERYGKKLNKKY